jgi:hypothetical protein
MPGTGPGRFRWLDKPAAVVRMCMRRQRRVPHRHNRAAGRPSCVPEKREPIEWVLVIDSNAISTSYLVAGDKIGNRLNQQALDCPLQVARAVPQVGAFPKQQFSRALGEFKLEWLVRQGCDDASLDQESVRKSGGGKGGVG